MRRSVPIFALLLSLLVPLTLHAQDGEERERFRYQVSWGSSDVASMRLDVGCKRGDHIPAALIAKSTGVANQIHSFDIRLDSFFVPGGRSLEGRTLITEEGEPRKFRSRFKTEKAVRVTKDFRGERSKKIFRLPGPSQDLLSWMLHLRHRELKTGKSYNYWVWDGWKLAKIEATVGKAESVSTSLGTRKAHSISLHRTVLHHGGPDRFKPRGDREELGTIWVGTDSARTPWAMTFDAPIGTAKITLKSVTRRKCD